MSYSLKDLIELLSAEKGEAIHLHPAESPVLEIKRVLHRIEGPQLAKGESESLLQSVASEDDFADFKRDKIVCFYHHFNESIVFQVMAFREDGQVRLEIRRFR
jgi:Tfp pilus assembly pilus retraction ATPase PilT